MAEDTPEKHVAINPKDIHGLKKPPLHLVPATAIIHESTAFRRGAKKYGPYNWREKRILATVYIAAIDRHVKSFLDGEDYDYDPVTKDYVHHMAAVRACAGILLDAMEGGQLEDDRPLKGKAKELLDRLTEKDSAT